MSIITMMQGRDFKSPKGNRYFAMADVIAEMADILHKEGNIETSCDLFVIMESICHLGEDLQAGINSTPIEIQPSPASYKYEGILEVVGKSAELGN